MQVIRDLGTMEIHFQLLGGNQYFMKEVSLELGFKRWVVVRGQEWCWNFKQGVQHEGTQTGKSKAQVENGKTVKKE